MSEELREDGSMKITDEIRKAGLKARDELLERMFDGGTVDNDLADRMESIIDACVRAALTTAPAVDAEPIGHIPKEQIADLESGGCAFVVRLMSMEGVENEYVPVYLATPAVAAEPSHQELREKALAATQGPWRISGFEIWANGNSRVIMGGDDFSLARIGERSLKENEADAEYICAASPDVILSLLSERDRLLAANEGMRKALEEIANPIDAMRRRAKEAGRELDGQMAVSLAKDPFYLQEIAREALSPALNSKQAPAGEGEANG